MPIQHQSAFFSASSFGSIFCSSAISSFSNAYNNSKGKTGHPIELPLPLINGKVCPVTGTTLTATAI
jgi:hypothetical protein